MRSKAERYRQHARECLMLLNQLVPGPQRDRVTDMAHEWVRLAPRWDEEDDE
jgi:hypothetical protein